MILRRLYLYLVSAAALATLATGLSSLGSTILLFAFNDPSKEYSRTSLAIATATTLVALPVWGVHFWFARRFAHRDPADRASAIRRLYVYWACLVMSIGAAIALNNALGNLFRPVIDCSLTGTAVGRPFDCGTNGNWLATSQAAWITVVLLAFWALHYRIAARDRAAVGEHGRSASLRRWYMYPVLLIGLLMMLSGTSSVIELGWLRILGSSLGTDQYRFVGDAAALMLAGAVLWGFHARVLALRFVEDDRKSTLRALEGFIAVAVSIVVALIGAGQILYYALARALGVSNPGHVQGDVLAALAQPASLLLVYGIAWYLIRRRLARDTGTHEAERQAGIRRLYTNLAALVSMAALAVGAAGVLWFLAEQAEAPLIGVTATDWKDPISQWITLLVVGAAVWFAHWRHAPWAGDRLSLSRRLYVWAALLASVLAVLGSGIALLNVVLQQVFSANPRLDNPDNLDFGHYLAVLVVAVVVGFYHWRVLRGDAASRPAKHEPAAAPPVAPMAGVAATTTVTAATVVAEPHGKRYILSIVDASEDDVHQALANLPPAASYHLTPSE
ncbi:MAG: hypothetical protein E6J18_04560 [Chloroflexi bacterium]|nr:MAG: hypothetical protein E6J18_04560 [Chloroflexota bacterium]